MIIIIIINKKNSTLVKLKTKNNNCAIAIN